MQADVADYFRSDIAKEKRSEMLNVRIPKSLRLQLNQVIDLWTKMAKAKLGNEAVEVSLGDVVVRLLTVGVEGVFADAGLKSRPTQAEIDELIRSMKSPS